jgi:hypothetical protein
VAAYRAAGFRDIYLPWPRTESELPVLRQVAREVLPALRGQTLSPEEPATESPRRDDLMTLDEAAVARAYAAVRDGTPRRLLDFLIDHPDERFNGATVVRHLELQRHDEVARGFAALAADLAEHGLARPWNEAQAGYLLPPQHAAILGRARQNRLQGQGDGAS